MQQTVTIQALKQAYLGPKGNQISFLAKHLFRPLSFYMTYLLIKCRITKPNHASYLGLVIGLIGAGLLMVSASTYSFWAASCYLLFYISDYCDGNLARFYNSASYFGKLLDGYIDTIVGGAYIWAVAIAAFVHQQNSKFLLCGALISSLYFLGCVYLSRYSFVARWLQTDKPELNIVANATAHSDSTFKNVMNTCSDLNNLLMGSLLVIKFHLAWCYLYLGNALVISLSMIIYTHYLAQKNLSVQRKSKWQA